MQLTAIDYERFALDHPDEKWELHHGELRVKPVMTFWHNHIGRQLWRQLDRQLDNGQYDVIVDQPRVNRPSASYYIPDLFVVPAASVRRGLAETPQALEAYSEPLPLVVDVWSPSTGGYDVDEKLSEYQRRGDLEIWRVHPYERTLTRWIRQPDGAYLELHQPATGDVQLVALAGGTIGLDALFA